MYPLLKLSFIIFLSFIILDAKSQFPKINGDFFSDTQDRISLSKQHGVIYFENENNRGFLFTKTVFISDTLKLYLDSNAIILDKEYVFKHVFSNDTFFILQPISKSAVKFLGGRKEVKFIKERFLYDSSINFERLIFFENKSNSFFSDGIALKIDSNKNVSFKFESGFNSMESGNFKGKLTDKGFIELVNILRKINIRTLFWPKAENNGEQQKELIIFFNGLRKKLKSTGSTPYITFDLIYFLSHIQENCIYNRIDDKINLEE